MRTLIHILLLSIITFPLLSKNLFESNFYEINFVSNDIEYNKSLEIEKIKKLSINNIFKNVLISDDYDKLSNILDSNIINSFIKNIIIEDEKIINDNYYSKVKINYTKKKIINFLRNNNYSYVEYLPSEYLIIILEKDNLSKKLFSINNTYYKYLNNNLKIFNIFKIPELSINDRYLLGINHIEELDIVKIDSFLKKYNSKNAIILVSNKIKKNKNYNLYFYFNNKLEKFHDIQLAQKDLNSIFTKIKIMTIDYWKLKNRIDNNINFNLFCEISYFNLIELKYMKSIISEISSLNYYNIRSLSLNKNGYYFNFFGDINLLPDLFINYGLILNIDNENQCKIYLK